MNHANIQNVEKWVYQGEQKENIYFLSPERFFAHPEESYDTQYNIQPNDLSYGCGLIKLLTERNADNSSPAWEIGCGTGILSLGIAHSEYYPLFLISDMSPSFIKITNKKINKLTLNKSCVKFIVYDSDSPNHCPPKESFSLITMKATLHHVLHPENFIQGISELLVSNGYFVIHEPCREGFILLGLLAKMYELHLEKSLPSNRFQKFFCNGLSVLQQNITNSNITWRTMLNNSRRDFDKSQMEDKHLFKTEELLEWGQKYNLDCEFIPNKEFKDFYKENNLPFSFTKFTKGYLAGCMGFSNSFIDGFYEFTEPYLKYIEECSAGTTAPVYHGIFLFKKRQ